MHSTQATRDSHSPSSGAQTHGMQYGHLSIMAVLSFFAMYFLMYAMVDKLENVFLSLNQVYMAGLMAAAMVIIELAVMGMMYPSKRLNLIIIAASAAYAAVFFLFIRQQSMIYESQFLRSMISHHAGAILMCENTRFHDAEIKQLCQNIIANQESEITQMKIKLATLD
jgi:uncharacterized protein (DUF305 family)